MNNHDANHRVCVKPAPRDFIESYVGGSDYWSNNIRKEFRLTSPPQIAFCDGFKNLLLELMVYVKAHHTTGVAWNSTKKGLVRVADFAVIHSDSLRVLFQEATEFNATAVSAAPAAVAAVAAPVAAKASAAPSAAVPKADLFSALNKGGAITSGSSPTLSFHTIQHLHTLHFIHTLLLVLQASRRSRRTCRLGGRSTKAAMPRPPP